MHTDYEKQIEDYNRAMAGNLNTWVAAAGGKEPITVIDGLRWQYSFNPATREHAYYCFDTDLIVDNRDHLPACLRG
jgi:hypothetical protein